MHIDWEDKIWFGESYAEQNRDVRHQVQNL